MAPSFENLDPETEYEVDDEEIDFSGRTILEVQHITY
jgi:hypothetical protein